ncbi:hypothetical protein N1851_006566 [Merluccius polli]|uniref:Uncharacterized protein n=1 Tax=Merluccius polli TaxID=89951 RepID=A0AA47N5P2_MERPO|nr:hypothetical protein N1851_006566 [Merluccius polli]
MERCPLQWWSKREGAHARLARKYLSTPATTVACESWQLWETSDTVYHQICSPVTHGMDLSPTRHRDSSLAIPYASFPGQPYSALLLTLSASTQTVIQLRRRPFMVDVEHNSFVLK